MLQNHFMATLNRAIEIQKNQTKTIKKFVFRINKIEF